MYFDCYVFDLFLYFGEFVFGECELGFVVVSLQFVECLFFGEQFLFFCFVQFFECGDGVFVWIGFVKDVRDVDDIDFLLCYGGCGESDEYGQNCESVNFEELYEEIFCV